MIAIYSSHSWTTIIQTYLLLQFITVSYGYSWKKVADIAHEYSDVLRSLPSHPGGGSIPLRHATDMLRYLISPAGTHSDRKNCVEHLVRIYDTLLKSPDAFLDEEVSCQFYY